MKRRELLGAAALVLGGALSPTVARAMALGVNGRKSIQAPCFDDHQRALCRVLAEMVIPQTDTPGAIEAGVPHFIELMVSDWYTEVEREIFFAGLRQLDEACQQQFDRPFLQCDSTARERVLTQMEKIASQYQSESPGIPILPFIDEREPFFTKLKELVVLGYYTSEVGAQQELKYLPMPMEYRNIDFAEVGRQWSY